MRPLKIADSATIVLGLQDEIRRSEESGYDHRLPGVLLGAQGMTCPEAGRLRGDAPRSVEYWVRRFEEKGLAGLVEGARSGRSRRLNESQLQELDAVLRRTPRAGGLTGTLWDGKALRVWIARHFQVGWGVRQGPRLFRQGGFRWRQARPLIAHADPERPRAHKKTPGAKHCSRC